ncbi:MAG: YbaK/EbsC family protein [Eubacterium sp.]|nr:YbaK/EbsC family protein [Eubacterium sp.]
MSLEKARKYLDEKGFKDRIIIPEHSSATVAEAAEALGCEPGMIAKTLSFLVNDRAVLILAEGMARIDNKKYKARFGCKAKMIPADQVEALVGHDIGGVCPFGIYDGVTVYLDESLKLHETVYPAAGTDHSAVRLSIAELEQCCGYPEWTDVCKSAE